MTIRYRNCSESYRESKPEYIVVRWVIYDLLVCVEPKISNGFWQRSYISTQINVVWPVLRPYARRHHPLRTPLLLEVCFKIKITLKKPFRPIFALMNIYGFKIYHTNVFGDNRCVDTAAEILLVVLTCQQFYGFAIESLQGS